MLSGSIVARLQHQQETLRELVKGLPEAALHQQLIPGKWTVLEQIAHLAAYQTMFYKRLQRIMSEDNPAFERYVAGNDPHFRECCQKPPSWLLEYVDTVRKSVNQFLESLPEKELQRTGLHQKYGKMTIPGWTEFFLLHEAHHLFSIFMLAREMNIDDL